jgi:mono/diheme cytochrome c family protein
MNYKLFRAGAMLGKFLKIFLFIYFISSVAVADSAMGKKIFEKNCMACHSLGNTRGIGPSLKGITDKRDSKWLKQAILNFVALKNAGDPLAWKLAAEYAPVLMPSQELSDAQLADLLLYLKDQTKLAKQDLIDKGLPRKFEAADRLQGKQLFIGKKVFRNGAISCMACHSVKGVAPMGGGTLGPDLTNTWSKFGEKGLIGVLQNPAFPTMKRLYENNPITEEEIFALLAFFETANTQKPFNYTPWFVGTAILILSGALWGLNFLYRKRFKNVRSKLTGGK